MRRSRSSPDVSLPVDDANRTYHRRMEQVQRELGLAPPDHALVSGPDRKRRRRDKEIRLAERQYRKARDDQCDVVTSDDRGFPLRPRFGVFQPSFDLDARQEPGQKAWSSAPVSRRCAITFDSSTDPGLVAQVEGDLGVRRVDVEAPFGRAWIVVHKSCFERLNSLAILCFWGPVKGVLGGIVTTARGLPR